MADAVVFKVRCPTCGKSLRVEAADVAAQTFCRACGTRLLTPPAPLLGSLGGSVEEVAGLPIAANGSSERSTLATGDAPRRPLATLLADDAADLPPAFLQAGASLAVPASEPIPVQPDAVLPAAPDRPSPTADIVPVFGFSEAETSPPAVPYSVAQPVDRVEDPWSQERPVGEDGSAASVAQYAPFSPPAVHRPFEAAPWAVVPVVPAVAPPPARLVPTRMEGPDPDEEAVRLGFAKAPPPPEVLPALPPLAQPAAGAARSPSSADEFRSAVAMAAAGQHRLVDGTRRQHSHPFWWTLLGMTVAAGVVLYVLVATEQVNWFSPWEKQVYSNVSQLKREAEGLSMKGMLPEAHERYQEIEKVIAGREVRDVALRQVVEDARADAARIYALHVNRNKPAPAVAVAPVEPATPAPQVVEPPKAPAAPGTNPPVAAAINGNTEQKPAVTEVKPPETPESNGEVAAARTPSGRPVPKPAPPERDRSVSDAEIGKAIQRGVDYLLKQFNNKPLLNAGSDPSDIAGHNALAIYALLQAGQAVEDHRLSPHRAEMRAKLDALRALPMTGGRQTYARGLRATCLALFNRPDDFKTMQADVDWLLGTTDGGAYTYNGEYKALAHRGKFASRQGSFDNSNSQYGLLGVWSAIDADSRIGVPPDYWRAVDQHWTKTQTDNGQWGYVQSTDSGTLSMTSAGIASLFVANEYLDAPGNVATVGREPFSPALKKGLEWFEQGDNAITLDGSSWWGYTLYGIERVGLASGYKYFGKNDWYRELSKKILAAQQGGGAWGDGIIDTSYALLFLSRGRHPILMNKLRFDGYWANRPRDVSNMARFAGRQFERPINWQVVNVEEPWTSWTDSPILYIASHEPPPLTDAQVDKLRQFSQAGGMIFTHADAGSPRFDAWVRALAKKLFPYELQPIPEKHPLWESVYRLTNRPALLGVSNGSRLLMVHLPSGDLSLKWQQRADRPFESRIDATRPAIAAANAEARAAALMPFEFGMNLFVYAAGKRDLRNRLDSAWVPAPNVQPIDTIRVARLQYDGNWNPEPGAWTRYANWFTQTTGSHLDVQPVKMSSLTVQSALEYPVAHLTGTARVNFGEADAAGLRKYVEGGGVVLMEPTGGMNSFDNGVRESFLPAVLPNHYPRLLDASHPVLTTGAPGMEDVSKTIVRGYTLERLGGGIGTLQIVTPEVAKPADGTPATPRRNPGAIIVTSLDVTSGLLGTNAWGILGFQNDYAQKLVKNVIFWAVDGRPQP